MRSIFDFLFMRLLTLIEAHEKLLEALPGHQHDAIDKAYGCRMCVALSYLAAIQNGLEEKP